MPLGKSGRHYYSPHEMNRRGDAPGGSDDASKRDPDPSKSGSDDAGAGDGNHHHEIHDHGDGTAHAVHTHPDGRKEDSDSGVTAESMTQGGDDANDAAAPAADMDSDELAGMYGGGCE